MDNVVSSLAIISIWIGVIIVIVIVIIVIDSVIITQPEVG